MLPRVDGNRDLAARDPFAKMFEFQNVQMRMSQEQMRTQQMMLSSMMAAITQQQSHPQQVVQVVQPAAVVEVKAGVRLAELVAGTSMNTEEDWIAATEFVKNDKLSGSQMAAIKSPAAELKKMMHLMLNSEERVNALTARLQTLKTGPPQG